MRASIIALAALLSAAPLAALDGSTLLRDGAEPVEEEPQGEQPPPPDPLLGPFFIGWESDPSMNASARLVSAIQGAGSGVLERATGNTGLAPAWEIPIALLTMVTQHEIGGHGGRAREYDLDPSYGWGYDFTFFTTIGRDPETNAQTTQIAAGGVESTTLLSQRLLLDFLREDGAEGALAPLLVLAKLDLTLYVLQTEDPNPPGAGDDPFGDQYREGNDMAIYLVARQGQRAGADPSALWQRDYVIDYTDPLLDDNWSSMKDAALWNMLDPNLFLTIVGYFQDHVGGGEHAFQTKFLPVSEELGLTASTRAFLGPAEVSLYLDVYLPTPFGVAHAYGREIDSGIDSTNGYGLGLHAFTVGPVSLSLFGDYWEVPKSLEQPARRDDGWHAGGQVDALFGNWGVSLTGGSKSEGYLPGLPDEEGAYFGFGALVRF